MTRFRRSKPGGRNRRCTEPTSTGQATVRLMEFAIRFFNGEMPGRSKNNPSRIATAAVNTRRLEEKRFTVRLSASAPTASHQRSATPHAPEKNRSDHQNRFFDIDRPASQTTSK